MELVSVGTCVLVNAVAIKGSTLSLLGVELVIPHSGNLSRASLRLMLL